MKKIIIVMLICFSPYLLIGCFAPQANKPDEVATNFLKGLAEQNFDIIDKYSVVESKKIQKPLIDEIIRKNSITEAEFYGKILAGEEIKKMPTNYEEYKKPTQKSFKKD